MATGLIVDVLITQVINRNIATLTIPANAEVHYKLFNATGKLVFSKSIITLNNNGKTAEDLNLSSLARGEYRLIVLLGDSKQEIENIKIIL